MSGKDHAKPPPVSGIHGKDDGFSTAASLSQFRNHFIGDSQQFLKNILRENAWFRRVSINDRYRPGTPVINPATIDTAFLKPLTI